MIFHVTFCWKQLFIHLLKPQARPLVETLVSFWEASLCPCGMWSVWSSQRPVVQSGPISLQAGFLTVELPKSPKKHNLRGDSGDETGRTEMSVDSIGAVWSRFNLELCQLRPVDPRSYLTARSTVTEDRADAGLARSESRPSQYSYHLSAYICLYLLILYHIISCHFNSFHIISFHIFSYHLFA